MGFRFRRSFKIAPGVRLNLSKSGVSTSIGTRGATVNIHGDRVRETVGIPGSGVSYSQQQRAGGNFSGLLIIVAILVALVWLYL